MIWQCHFARPRVHIIFGDGFRDPIPQFMNRTVSDLRSCINHEASTAAAEARRRFRQPVSFARDVIDRFRYRQPRDPHSPDRGRMPLFVDWAVDLVCLTPQVPGTYGNAMLTLSGHPWTGQIRKLAIHVSVADVLDLPRGKKLDEMLVLLAPFTSVEEFHLVFGMGEGTGPLWRSRQPNEYGFMPFDAEAEDMPWGPDICAPIVLKINVLLTELKMLLRNPDAGLNRQVELKTATNPSFYTIFSRWRLSDPIS